MKIRKFDINVILLIDNFSIHEKDWNIVFAEDCLTIIIFIFLFKNSICFCQSLNQNIIKVWKIHYRRRWLLYMCTKYEINRNFVKTCNVLMIIRWNIAIWNYDVFIETIFNCWLNVRMFFVKQESMIEQKTKKYDYMNEMRKTVFSINIAKKTTHRIDANAIRLNFEMQIVINDIKNNIYIDTIMNVKQWIDFSSKHMNDTKKNVFEYVMKLYKKNSKRKHETNEKNEIVSMIKQNNVLYATNMLRKYEKQ